MPFFKRKSSQQIKSYCEGIQLAELYLLNQRYGALFHKLDGEETQNKKKIEALKKQINEINVQIDKQAQAINEYERYRQNVLDNLPGNAAERYLVLQSVSYPVTDNRDSFEVELNQLNTRKDKLVLRNAWIGTEKRACLQELKIINKVIEEKELDAQSRLEHSGSVR